MIEERDDFGNDEDEQVKTTPVHRSHPRNRRRLFCNRQGCDEKVALELDRAEGYYVCTQCGTIANVPNRIYRAFCSLVGVVDGCLRGRRTRGGEIRRSQITSVHEDQQFEVEKNERAKIQKFKFGSTPSGFGTAVPKELVQAQRSAGFEYKQPVSQDEKQQQRREQLTSVVDKLLAELKLPDNYRGDVVKMATEYIQTLERERRGDLNNKMQKLAETTFTQAVAEAAAVQRPNCVDCYVMPPDGKKWQKRTVCGCYQCEDCVANEWYEENIKPTKKQEMDTETKEEKPFVHSCQAPAPTEASYNAKKRRRIARNGGRTLVNAITSIAAACIYLHVLKVKQRRYRWHEITQAVQRACNRVMKRDTVTRWVGKITDSLKLPRSSNLDMVIGFANHYLDQLQPTTSIERTRTKDLIACVMGQTEARSAFKSAKKRAVVGRVYSAVLDAELAPQVQEKDARMLHRQQPWLLAAVCVYLALQLERAKGDKNKNKKRGPPKIADLCRLLKVDQASFQKCKRNIARFI